MDPKYAGLDFTHCTHQIDRIKSQIVEEQKKKYKLTSFKYVHENEKSINVSLIINAYFIEHIFLNPKGLSFVKNSSFLKVISKIIPRKCNIVF